MSDMKVCRRLVLTVGNELMGDDGAGPALARMLESNPLDGWDVLDGGSAPENYLYKIREMEPEQVLIVDAADMQLSAGAVQMIDREQIGSLFLVTTHSLPLSFLMDAIGEFVPSVQMVGIQPGMVAFGFPLSAQVQDGVERVYGMLKESLYSGSEDARLVKDEIASSLGSQGEAPRTLAPRNDSGSVHSG